MSDKPARSGWDRVAFGAFWASTVALALGYGVVAGMLKLFPYGLFADGVSVVDATKGHRADWFYTRVQKRPPPVVNSGGAEPGVNLVTAILKDRLSVKVMDLDGKTLHQWAIDWFALWPDAKHVPARLVPREPPGTHVNGAVVLEGGDLVFNFEHLGLVRLDRGGNVVWRLPYQTHHSIHRAGDGKLWVCGQKERTAPLPDLPMLVPPFVEDTLLVVSPQGEVIKEWSVPELLRTNGRAGLLCLASQDNFSTAVSGDVTHLNHVEPFPAGMTPGFFGPGDVLVSLRNVNTVFVFDRRSGSIKLCSTGQFVRQHDPHFVDGDTISVFDNNNTGAGEGRRQSRIALLSGPGQTVSTYFAGTPETPFFTPILGRHQWLPNGNLLITDSCAGRAFELDRDRQVVWWYINYVDTDVVGAVEQVQRIPAGYGGFSR